MAVGNEEVYQDEIQELIAGVPFTSLLRTAIQCAGRAIPAWDAHAPNDPSVGTALNDVSKLMDGLTLKAEVLKWKTVLGDRIDQASDAFQESVLRTRYRTLSEAPPHGVAAHNAKWCVSAISALVSLATVDEQTEDIEDIQKERESLFADVVVCSWVASLYDANERRWQLETIKKLTNRDIPERIEKRLNELDRYSHRGDFFFFSGLFRYPMVVTEYDQMIELDPELKTSHWQRGIALFYEDRYEEGAKQFEAYFSFDDVDRQSGIWRYFCQRKAYGLEKARAGLLKYKKDDREPFPDVYRLFAGEITPDEILTRIESAKINADEREMRRFYAELYIGLNEFVECRTESARAHLGKAIANTWARQAGYGPNFMWHVARLSTSGVRRPSEKELSNDSSRFGDNRAWKASSINRPGVADA